MRTHLAGYTMLRHEIGSSGSKKCYIQRHSTSALMAKVPTSPCNSQSRIECFYWVERSPLKSMPLGICRGRNMRLLQWRPSPHPKQDLRQKAELGNLHPNVIRGQSGIGIRFDRNIFVAISIVSIPVVFDTNGKDLAARRLHSMTLISLR